MAVIFLFLFSKASQDDQNHTDFVTKSREWGQIY